MRPAWHVSVAGRGTRIMPALPETARPRPVRTAAVMGAGTMGVGIAVCFANAAIPVTILDISEESLAQGLDRVDQVYQTMVKRGRLTPDEKQRRMRHIRGTLDYTDLSDADVIIEAIFESMDLKPKIFAALDRVAKPAARVSTKTSTSDVTGIALATQRPQS